MRILITLRFYLLLVVLCLMSSQSVYADNKADIRTITFGVVPQQAAAKVAAKWVPLLRYLEEKTGFTVVFRTAKDIPTFEQRLIEGEYDFVYMNPFHYTVTHKMVGYQAITKARDTKLKGIMVVRKDSGIKTFDDLKGKTLAFPSPAAFAASILVQTELRNKSVDFTPKYVSSHDSVYRAVAAGIYPAGGGVIRTFKSVDAKIREQLQVFWISAGSTPHAIAHHPRIDKEVAESISKALISLNDSPQAASILSGLKIKGFINATDSDWDDIRALSINHSVGLEI